MHSENFALIENFKSLLRQAMLYAQSSHDSIPDESIDWNSVSALAACIALAVSIICPVITTCITLQHQRKLRDLDIKEKRTDFFLTSRNVAIGTFISSVGKCLFYSSPENFSRCGESYFRVYAYAPQDLWPLLDDLYFKINDNNWTEARPLFNTIAKRLSCILEEGSSTLP